MASKISFLDDLNPSQQAAVAYNGGPSLVIAGAGSGKTRVLTYKIAYLLQMGLPAQTILALTFTNKAAREMKERIACLVGYQTARYLWMGTFHSIFRHILQAEADKLGYTHSFSIYDTNDSKSLIKSIIKEKQLDTKVYTTGAVLGRISAAKNSLISPKAYSQNPDLQKYDRQQRTYLMGELYAEYARRCKQANAMDFDDLLYNTNLLFRDYPDTLRKYQETFNYILVDEYQDTNFAQYLIIKKLAEKHQHICVVGDDAQSIYSFRGANIQNILNFQETYPDSRIFKLEQNYRSTQNIVNAANSIIAANKAQIPKHIFSEKEKGELLHLSSCFTDLEEASLVGQNIAQLHRRKDIAYNQMAILYRTNSQSRVLEDSMRKYGIPYRIYGGQAFYQRKEIKDALAYLRLLINTQDEEALKRIINVPARGIGETTITKLEESARQHETGLWDVLSDPLKYNVSINGGTAKKLDGFKKLICGFRELHNTLDAYELVESVIKLSGMAADAMKDKNNEGLSRYENLQELLNSVHEFTERQLRDGIEQITLEDFLGEVALITDQDEDNGTEEKVTLMTIHAAKGLEFNTVFIVGVEEGLFPSSFSESVFEIEEERRLFYVAVTRAEERCYISFAKSRFRNGKTNFSSASRFISDIDERYLDDTPHKQHNLSGNTFFRDEEEERQWWNRPKSDEPVAPATQPRNITKIGTSYLKTDEKQTLSHPDFPEGCTVRHGVFGIGTVIQCYRENDSDKIEVDFAGKGKKHLLLKFAKLERID